MKVILSLMLAVYAKAHNYGSSCAGTKFQCTMSADCENLSIADFALPLPGKGWGPPWGAEAPSIGRRLSESEDSPLEVPF